MRYKEAGTGYNRRNTSNKNCMRVRDIKQWFAPLRDTPLQLRWLLRGGPGARDLQKFDGVTVDTRCADQAVRHRPPRSAQYIGIDAAVPIGRASESAAVLLNLALARLTLSPLLPHADFMPHRVRVLCLKQ